MSSSAWPAVIAAVKSTATTALAPTRVIRGKDTSNDPTDVVMIGVIDPESDPADAGSFQQAMQTFGAMGVTKELPLQLMHQQVRLMRVYEGPSEVHRSAIGRRILGSKV